MLQPFATQEQFAAAIYGRLPDGNWSAGLRTAIAEALANTTQPEAAGGTSHELRVGTWFLRDDDVPFFQAIGVVGPLVATALTAGTIAAPALVAGVASLLGSAWRVWRKGGRLTSGQVAALTLLKAHGPLSVEDLAEHLVREKVVVSADATRTLLDQLLDIETRDGSSVALVHRTPEGLWRTVNA
jgi:hypothetical protein